MMGNSRAKMGEERRKGEPNVSFAAQMERFPISVAAYSSPLRKCKFNNPAKSGVGFPI